MEGIEILPEDISNYDISFKVTVIGDSDTGKTYLIFNQTINYFDNNQNYKDRVNFSNFSIRYNNRVIKLQIWDTPGAEIYRSLNINYYRNSSLVIIAYSIIMKNSFEHVENFLREVRDVNPNAKIVLVGTKLDLEDSREVSKDEAENFVKEHNLDMLFEISAISANDTKKVFIEAAKLLFTQYLKSEKEKEERKNAEKKEEDKKNINPKKKERHCHIF